MAALSAVVRGERRNPARRVLDLRPRRGDSPLRRPVHIVAADGRPDRLGPGPWSGTRRGLRRTGRGPARAQAPLPRRHDDPHRRGDPQRRDRRPLAGPRRPVHRRRRNRHRFPGERRLRLRDDAGQGAEPDGRGDDRAAVCRHAARRGRGAHHARPVVGAVRLAVDPRRDRGRGGALSRPSPRASGIAALAGRAWPHPGSAPDRGKAHRQGAAAADDAGRRRGHHSRRRSTRRHHDRQEGGAPAALPPPLLAAAAHADAACRRAVVPDGHRDLRHRAVHAGDSRRDPPRIGEIGHRRRRFRRRARQRARSTSSWSSASSPDCGWCRASDASACR